jgi:outer membrane protein assembly factor BamB
MTRMAILVGMVTLAFTSRAAAEEPVTRFLTGRLPANQSKPTPPDRWSATENVLWKTDFPGLGWSSPIVWGNHVFLTTCVNTGVTREPRKGLYLEDVDANKYPKDTDKHEWKVFCLDLNSGKVVWERVAHTGVPAKPHHIKNTLASETPTTDGERIYAYFGNLGMYCYDMQGKLLWTYLTPPTETNYAWGTSASPIVYQDRVYIVNDNNEKSYMVALDKATGEVVWRVDRDEKKTNYATPFIWKNELRTELVTSGIDWTRSYDLDGKLLWQLKGKSILALPTPFTEFGYLYLTSGHVLWGGNPLYAIKPGATGDISLGDTETTNEYIAWSHQKAGPYHPTPLIVGDTLYILYDRGFLAAYDAKTGREIYGRKRIPEGGAGFTSSPWSYDDKLFCLNEDGRTLVLKTGPEFGVLHINSLAEDDMGMATPVIVGDKLLLRTSARIYCIGNKSATAAR